MRNMRKVDKQGRVTLPLAVRQAIGVKTGDALDVTVTGSSVQLTAHNRRCAFCGTQEDVIDHGSAGICSSCAGKIFKKIGEVPV